MESICFYRRDTIPNKNDEEFLLCFILDDLKYNLDLFRNELDFYFKNYIEHYYANTNVGVHKLRLNIYIFRPLIYSEFLK